MARETWTRCAARNGRGYRLIRGGSPVSCSLALPPPRCTTQMMTAASNPGARLEAIVDLRARDCEGWIVHLQAMEGVEVRPEGYRSIRHSLTSWAQRTKGQARGRRLVSLSIPSPSDPAATRTVLPRVQRVLPGISPLSSWAKALAGQLPFVPALLFIPRPSRRTRCGPYHRCCGAP